MNVGQWVETLELGEQSPIPIINHYNQLLERTKRTNDEIEIMEMEENESRAPLAGAALRGLHCVAPAQRATEIDSVETQTERKLEMSKKNSKSEIRSVPAASTVGAALLACIDPVIAKLDSFHHSESGHELPSRTDLTLRITLSNMCYNIHTQIHGSAKFSGIKASYDKAANAWGNLCEKYATRPEQQDDDPDSDKFFTWYEQTGAKMAFLEDLLVQFKDVYQQVTGEAWAPRPVDAAKPVVDPKRAERMLAAKRAAMAARNQISEDSVLIKAS